MVILEQGNPAFLKVFGLEDAQFTQLTSGYDQVYLGVGVLRRCIGPWLRLRRPTSKQLGLIYLVACLRQIGARVVLTFIDNSILFYYLAAECPDIHFVAVQNGSKEDGHPSFNSDALVAPATYFCFGDCDVLQRADSTLRVANVIPVGSVLSSYYKETRRKPCKTNTYDVCLISPFRRESVDDPTHFRMAGFRKLADYVARVRSECRLKVCVAGLTLDDERERAFYEDVFGDSVHFSFREFLSTYALMDDSRVVVGLCSTSLYEAFSWGKKTLFCPFYDEWDGQRYPKDELSLLQGAHVDYARFKERLQTILDMDDTEYAERSRSEARFFVRHDPDRPASEVVRAHLRGLLGDAADDVLPCRSPATETP